MMALLGKIGKLGQRPDFKEGLILSLIEFEIWIDMLSMAGKKDKKN